jgi:hypothetical protein
MWTDPLYNLIISSNMRINFPHFDLFSFWVGFIFACLIWFLLKISHPTFDLILQRIKEKNTAIKNRTVRFVEENYLKDLFQHVQGLHLASSLFSLDEVLIEPKLLAPPPRISPDETDYAEDFVSELVPYLPDWPEIAAAYSAPTLSIANALSGNSDIVITGQPGTGKSVALAYLASSLAQHSIESGLPANLIPFLVHLADINLSGKNNKDSVELITDVILGYSSSDNHVQTIQFIKKTFIDGNALLLLDGTDELTPQSLNPTIEFIRSLKQNYPLTKIITTGIPENLNGLVTLNFIPFTLACWEPSNQKKFLIKWEKLWSQQFYFSEQEILNKKQIDHSLLNNWIYSICSNLSPFELTLLTWGCYAGDIKSGKILDTLFSHIQRLKPSDVPLEALEMLALHALISANTTFDPTEAQDWIKEFELDETFKENLDENLNHNSTINSNNPKKEKQNISPVPSRSLISKLADSGLLTVHKNNKLRFSHQIFGGLLAGNVLGTTNMDKVLHIPNWSGKYLAMNYFAAFHDGTNFANKLIVSSGYPLHRNVLLVSRWLRNTSLESKWRTPLMEKLVEIIKTPGQPLGLRGQVLAALVRSNDEGVPLLFRQMLESDDPDLLQLCILGSAILKDLKSVEKIALLLDHKSPNVVRAACLGLITIGTHSALDHVGNLLLHADKDFRKAAAEALANDNTEGYAMLIEGAAMDDILVRWAVVYGLGRVNEPWAADLLSKLRLEDDQWIVRNAANEMLEKKLHPVLSIPKRLPPASECPWLIAFAAKKGLGISPNTPATEVLLMALTEGTELEQLASLDYLRISSSPKIFPIFNNYLNSPNSIMREAIFRTIWEMASRGVVIPDPWVFEAS